MFSSDVWWLAVPLAVLVLVLVFTILLPSRGDVSLKVGPIRLEARDRSDEIREHLEQGGGETFEERQYALVREYHARGLAQSVQSFWFSLISAALGFLVIVSTIIYTMVGVNPEISISVIQLVSGAVIEAVSALFFVQSNKARELLVAFFDKLREDRKLEESVRFARDMDAGALKDRLQATMAASFSGSVQNELTIALLDHVQPSGVEKSTM